MPTIVNIRINGGDQTLKIKHLLYPEDGLITVDRDNPTLKCLVDEAISKFKGLPETISIKIDFQW